MSDIILEGKEITKTFHDSFGGRPHRTLDKINVSIGRKETLGLMGPSGCGKSTLARILLLLIRPDEGSIFFEGREMTGKKRRELGDFRKKVQLISQRPESFFDPRIRLGESILEPLSFYGKSGKRKEDEERLHQLLEQVKLTEELLTRYPHQVSGGEIQRLSLCRALLLEPEILVLDEPTSMLDISVQAQILQILKELKEKHGLSYLFITHDKEAAAFMCDRIQKMEASDSFPSAVLQN